jgi:hypothetical protein
LKYENCETKYAVPIPIETWTPEVKNSLSNNMDTF